MSAVRISLWLVPIVIAFALVQSHGVNVPCEDDLAQGVFLNALHSHGLRWSDLISQHNESRLLTLRLLDAAITLGGHASFDVRLIMVASVLTAAATGSLLFQLARQTFTTPMLIWTVALASNCLVLLPAQWLNFLWGIQWITFVPGVAVVLALVVLDEAFAPASVGLLIAIFAAAFATYTNSNGFLLWGLLVPRILVRPSPTRWWAVATWSASATLVLGSYFHHYAFPPNHVDYAQVLFHPWGTLRFLLAFLGNGLRLGDDPSVDVKVGTTALAIVGAAMGIILLSRDQRLARRAMPWMTVAMYAVASGVLATLGRSALGIAWAIPPRYPTFALPLYVSIFPLWLLAGTALVSRWEMPTIAAVSPCVIVFAWVVVLAWRSVQHVRGERDHAYGVRLTCLALVQWLPAVADETAVERYLFPHFPTARNILDDMERNGLIHHEGKLDARDLRPIEVHVCDGGESPGRFESLSRAGTQLQATGWATLPGRCGRSADAVLLTVRESSGADRVIAITGLVHERRPDRHVPANQGWTRLIAAAHLATGTTVSAWAYDATAYTAYRLAGECRAP